MPIRTGPPRRYIMLVRDAGVRRRHEALAHEPASSLVEVRGLEVNVLFELALRVDPEACAGLREEGHVHHPIADREDLVLGDPPLRGELPNDFALSPRTHVDRHVSREDAVLVSEFVAV